MSDTLRDKLSKITANTKRVLSINPLIADKRKTIRNLVETRNLFSARLAKCAKHSMDAQHYQYLITDMDYEIDKLLADIEELQKEK